MAGVDKIYGTKDEYIIFKKWLEKENPKLLCGLYGWDWKDDKEHPISNFLIKEDFWLLKHCPFEFVTGRIKARYVLHSKKYPVLAFFLKLPLYSGVINRRRHKIWYLYLVIIAELLSSALSLFTIPFGIEVSLEAPIVRYANRKRIKVFRKRKRKR